MQPPPERTGYGRRDLLAAYVAFVATGERPKSREAALYGALSEAFGVRLDEPPVEPRGPRPDWMDLSRWETSRAWRDRGEDGVGILIEIAARSCSGVHSPFAGFIEMTPAIQQYRKHYGRSIGAAVRSLREQHFELMEEVLAHAWGLGPGAMVSAEAVRAAGWNPDDWPDLDDF